MESFGVIIGLILMIFGIGVMARNKEIPNADQQTFVRAFLLLAISCSLIDGSVNTIRYKEQKKELEFTKNGVIILEKNLDETHRKLDLILKNQTETKNEIVKIKMNMPLQVAEPANEQTKQQITK